MTKTKIKPVGGLKVIVADSNGQPKVLGTIAIWEHATPAQKWAMENSGAELNAQIVYVKAEEEFSLENELSLKVNNTKSINSNYKVKIREV